MDPEVKNKLNEIAQMLLVLLAKQKYDEIANLTRNNRMPAYAIRQVISEYGRTVVNPPSSVFEELDIIEIEHSLPRKWSVIFPLWTLEEGKSDLSVDITCVEIGNDLFEIELNDIHVL